MIDLAIHPLLLAAIFFIIAFLYSSVGLAGGSSYTALLAIFGVNYLIIPTLTLILNLFVSTIGTINYIRKKHLRAHIILPFLISSVPMSYLGGSLKVPKQFFYWVLLISLIFVAIRIYLIDTTSLSWRPGKFQQLAISLLLGALLGFVAGVAGIGGGIYLVPFIIILGLGTTKEAAACGSAFIWINSLSGVIARAQFNAVNIIDFIPVICAVILGGFLGSYMGAGVLKPKTMEKLLGGIVIMAIFFLAGKLW